MDESDKKGLEDPEGNQYGTFVPMEADRKWTSGICGCSCKQCCCGLFCMPCLAGSVGSRAKETCGCFVACICLGALRTKFRTMFGIKGSICDDVFISWLCTPCVLCQLEREMDFVGI